MKEAAAKATPGPWKVSKRNEAFVMPADSLLDGIGTAVFAAQVSNSPNFRNDARFIAICNPANVFALIAEVERQAREIERLKAIQSAYENGDEEVLAEIEAEYSGGEREVKGGQSE